LEEAEKNIKEATELYIKSFGIEDFPIEIELKNGLLE